MRSEYVALGPRAKLPKGADAGSDVVAASRAGPPMSELINGRPPGAVRREVAEAEAARPIRNVSLREMVEAMARCPADETFRWYTVSYVNERGEPVCSETLRVTMAEARKAVGI